jgi:hypothetical protein
MLPISITNSQAAQVRILRGETSEYVSNRK